MQLSSFRIKVMATLILASTIVVLTLGGVWLLTARSYIEDSIYSSDVQDSRHMAESVRMYINDITHNMEIFAGSPDTVSAFQKNDTAGLEQVANALRASAPAPDIVLFIDNNGDVRYSSKAAGLKDIRMNYWYDEAARSEGPFITGLYNSPALNEHAFAILVPIKGEGTAIGRIMAVFTSENFQDSLKEHNLDPRDSIIVVDKNGYVVSSNELSKVSRGMSLSQYTPVKRVIRGESGVATHGDAWDGEARISAYLPVEGIGWGVIVSTPQYIEYRPLYEQVEIIIGTLLLFIVIFSALGYYASRHITEPIVKLSGTMKRIASGDYDIRVGAERQDEIGELARSFNLMLDRLAEARSQSDMYLDLMGHDINNMNQVALGYLELADSLIRSGGSIDKGNEHMVKKPIAILEDASRLIGNVRKLKKAKSMEPNKTINLNTLLEGLARMYSEIPGREVNISFKGAGEHLVHANELIEDVFSNIIWNAIKHSDAQKPLAVSIKIDEASDDGRRFHRVVVEDDGPGIDDSLKAKIFTRLARGNTRAMGSGLGLYLVKALVEGYNGRVWVEDRVPGDHMKGARFVVMLPAAIS